MKSLENQFISSPSASYSDEVNSDNVASTTMPIDPLHQIERNTIVERQEKLNFYNTHSKKFQDQHYEESTRRDKGGRNSFAFWAIVVILLILTVGNLLLTLTIIGALRMGKGIYGMELIPEEDVVKFYGETDLDRIFSKNTGQFEGFADEPVVITGENSPIYVRMHHRNSQMVNRMIMDELGVQFRGVNGFEIKDPINGNSILTTHRPHYNIPHGAEHLLSKTNSASRIASPVDKPLTVVSPDDRIIVKGSQGIEIDAENIYMQAESNICINSTLGGIHLESGPTGIYLDINKVPIVDLEMGLRTGGVQYKLCICMPLGIIFRIAIPRIHNGSKISCGHFSGKYDPCLVN